MAATSTWPLEASLKRAIDIVGALALLTVTLPIILLIALAVMVSTGRPVLYRGWRVGRDGRIFRIVKFRTMSTVASGGRTITVAEDPRVTRVGRLLRRAKLDELPQLINVLSGDMSLVGPRPEHPNYVRLYSEAQRRVLSVRPGITGAASVQYRDEEAMLVGKDPESAYRTLIMPDKLRLELEYLDRRSIWSDLGLILATVVAVGSPRRPGLQPKLSVDVRDRPDDVVDVLVGKTG
jgi:lipopolysaccharide/colanic/teichoic acid biosynthesis glycosyltransferase